MSFVIPSGVPLSQIPAMRPPPGAVSNFDNPETSSGPLIVLNWLFTALAIIAVGLRVYARFPASVKQGKRWDDAFCLFAMAGSIVHAVLIKLSVDYGYGRHLWDLRAFNLTPERLRIITLSDHIYIVTIFSIKISILIFYYRLFGLYRTSRRLIYSGYVANTIFAVPYLGVSISRTIRCNGLGAIGDPLCTTHTVSTIVTIFGVLNTILDFYTLVIPIGPILKLQLSSRKKIGLLAIFLTGLVACLMSTVRLAVVIVHFNDSDVLWHAATVSPLSITEMNLAIICSCATFVPAIVKKIKGQKPGVPSAASSGRLVPVIGGKYRSISKSSASRNETKDTEEQHVELQNIGDWEQSTQDLPFLTDRNNPTMLPAPPARVRGH